MFLQIVTFVGNVSDDFVTIGEAHLGDFAHRGVRLFGRARHDLDANATTKRRILQSRRLGLVFYFRAALADQLIDCRHFILKFIGQSPATMRSGQMERGIYTAQFFLARIISTILEDIIAAGCFQPDASRPWMETGSFCRAKATKNTVPGHGNILTNWGFAESELPYSAEAACVSRSVLQSAHILLNRKNLKIHELSILPTADLIPN